jgi:hypothetical protein
MYLVFSAFTSTPISLITTNNASCVFLYDTVIVLSVDAPVICKNETNVTVYISSLRGTVNWQTKEDSINPLTPNDL